MSEIRRTRLQRYDASNVGQFYGRGLLRAPAREVFVAGPDVVDQERKRRKNTAVGRIRGVLAAANGKALTTLEILEFAPELDRSTLSARLTQMPDVEKSGTRLCRRYALKGTSTP
jgi:hypothetical protein